MGNRNVWLVCALDFRPSPKNPNWVDALTLTFGARGDDSASPFELKFDDESINATGELWVVYRCQVVDWSFRWDTTPEETDFPGTPIIYKGDQDPQGNRCGQLQFLSDYTRQNAGTVVIHDPDTQPGNIVFQLAVNNSGTPRIWDPKIINDGTGQ